MPPPTPAPQRDDKQEDTVTIRLSTGKLLASAAVALLGGVGLTHQVDTGQQEARHAIERLIESQHQALRAEVLPQLAEIKTATEAAQRVHAGLGAVDEELRSRHDRDVDKLDARLRQLERRLRLSRAPED